MITTGDTFLVPTPPNFTVEHLYIIIFENNDDNEVLMVNVTAKKPSSDTSCILRVSDHPYIKKESVINYAEAISPKISNVEDAIKKNIFRTHAPVSPELLCRIQEGALVSTALLPKYVKYISSDV